MLMAEIRVLCFSCSENYRESGYILHKQNDVKQRCYICGRLGFEYKIKKWQAVKNGK